MSKFDIQIDTDNATNREKLRELATSDRASAPVYQELFVELYGEEPE